MALLKLTRCRLIAFISCAILPTFLLSYFIQVSQAEHFLSFPSFLTLSGKFGPLPESPLPTSSHPLLSTAIESPSTASVPNSITNNHATYPRLSLTGSRYEYAQQARVTLQRLESVQDTLFDGSGLNDDMMARLISYLKRAESDQNYVPPKVPHFHED